MARPVDSTASDEFAERLVSISADRRISIPSPVYKAISWLRDKENPKQSVHAYLFHGGIQIVESTSEAEDRFEDVRKQLSSLEKSDFDFDFDEDNANRARTLLSYTWRVTIWFEGDICRLTLPPDAIRLNFLPEPPAKSSEKTAQVRVTSFNDTMLIRHPRTDPIPDDWPLEHKSAKAARTIFGKVKRDAARWHQEKKTI